MRNPENLKIDIDSKVIKEDVAVTGFKSGDLKIYIEDGYYKIFKGSVFYEKINIDDFRKKTFAVIKRIRMLK